MEPRKHVFNMNTSQSIPGIKPTGRVLTVPLSSPRRPIIEGLSAIDNGRVIERIKYLRAEYESISPEEIHLIIDAAEVGSTAEIQFSRKAHRLEGWRNSLVLASSDGHMVLAWSSRHCLCPKTLEQTRNLLPNHF